MRLSSTKNCVFIIAAFLSCLAFTPALYGNDGSAIWGKVLSSEGFPVKGAEVRVFITGSESALNMSTTSSGFFYIPGLPAVRCSLQISAAGYKPLIMDGLFLQPSNALYIKAVLISGGPAGPESTGEILSLDYTHTIQQTVINEHQIQNTPSAHNVWALIENQDLSATSNRIDIGGLWGNIPAVFSGRGGISWTQSAYLLNGIDATDPYDTGRPLFFPDFHALRWTQSINAGHPPSAISPGGYLNLLTRKESSEFHGGISAFYIHNSLQASNISPQLREEGIEEPNGFDYQLEGNVQFTGPLITDKLSFFASISANDLSRDMAEFDEMDKSRVLSGLLSFRYKLESGDLRFLWTGQNVTYSSFGAGRSIPFQNTTDRDDTFQVLQGIWNTCINGRHSLKAAGSYACGRFRSRFQQEGDRSFGIVLFGGKPSGTAPMASDDTRKSLTLCVNGDSFLGELFQAQHRLRYGFSMQYALASSIKEIKNNTHLRFFEDESLEVVRYNTPVNHEETGLSLNVYLQDSLTFGNFLSFYMGLSCDYSRGWVPDTSENEAGAQNRIRWLNLSPRMGVIIPLSPSKKAALKLSFARYYFRLPLSYLTYGNPGALGGQVYGWNDRNGDRLFQANEKEGLLRREGPLYASIDPELKRPYTQEFNIVYSVVFGPDWSFTLGGYYRGTRNQVKTLNVGVPFSEYDPKYILDLGDDYLRYTPDDQIFTVFNQKKAALGNDFFLLSNVSDDRRTSHYFGSDITIVKRFSRRFSFFFSFTAIFSEATTNPGDSEMENDDGVVGSLYDNPNTLINAKGRIRWDRGYTARLGLTHKIPFGLKMGAIIKYYDGQPFARKIIVTGFNQGPFFIQAHSRGAVRFEYNLNLDLRLEKEINLGKGKMRMILDGFNILNMGLATEENVWDGPDFKLRRATEILSPRVFRLGLSYNF